MAGALAKAKGVKAFFAKRGKQILHILTAPFRMSLPARAAWCFAGCMLLILAGVWIAYAWSPQHVPWAAYMSWPRGFLVVGSIALAAYVVYWTVRLWLAEEPVNHALRKVWRKGLFDLKQNGLPVDGLPIHLVLGLSSADEGRRLLNASGEYRFQHEAQHNEPFSWAASGDRICVNAHAIGLASLAATALDKQAREQHAALPHRRPTLSRATCLALTTADSSTDPLLSALQQAGVEPSHDGGPVDSTFANEPAANTASPEAWQTDQGGTATLTRPAWQQQATPLAVLDDPDPAAEKPLWSLTEAVAATEDLRQLASLLRNQRRPLCPVNRIVITVPFLLLTENPDKAVVLQRAIRRDLETVQQRLQINAPVCVLVTGVEEHPGFLELIRRVGPDVAREQCLGQSLEVGCPTDRTQLAALANATCAKIEDWIYALLRDPSAVSNPGNTLLYRLLCDVRSRFRGALAEILTGGLAHDAVADTALARQHVAGCYFTATGTQPHDTGFVAAVFQTQDAAQDDIDWLPTALSRETRHRWLARLGWLITGGLVLSLLTGFGYWLFCK